VAVGVVDLLEPVEVDGEQAEPGALRACFRDRLAEPGVEAAPVHRTGHRVARRREPGRGLAARPVDLRGEAARHPR
jgi:hypothetical protein